MIVRFDVVPTLFAVLAVLLVGPTGPLRESARRARAHGEGVARPDAVRPAPSALPRGLAGLRRDGRARARGVRAAHRRQPVLPGQPAGPRPAGRVRGGPPLRGLHARWAARWRSASKYGSIQVLMDGAETVGLAADRSRPRRLRPARVVAPVGPARDAAAGRRGPRRHARVGGHQPRVLAAVQRVARRHRRGGAAGRPVPRALRPWLIVIVVCAAHPGRLSVVGHPAGHRRSARQSSSRACVILSALLVATVPGRCVPYSRGRIRMRNWSGHVEFSAA